MLFSKETSLGYHTPKEPLVSSGPIFVIDTVNRQL